MTKSYDIAVKVGVRKEGNQEKPNWLTIGSIHEGDKGPFLLLAKWFNPSSIEVKSGSESILCSLFKPKAKTDTTE